MLDVIIVRPNDRLIRGVLVCAAMAWWVGQGVEFVRDRSGLVVFAPFWLVLFAAMAWLLAWVTVGRWVFRATDSELVVERRLARIGFWRTVYPTASISDFRVEEDRRKIKGNTSLCYRVLMDRVSGIQEVTWYRRRADAEKLAVQLQALTREQPERMPMATVE